MQFRDTTLPGAVVIDLDRRVDDRGFFARSYCDDEFAAHGLPTTWPQCNLSRNARAHTLRGMHYNAPPDEEAKIVRCVSGAIWDAIVDLRADAPTFLRWFGIELSAERGNALYVPPGFAHGYVTLSDGTDVFYHMGRRYRPDAARGLRWNDPRIGIAWPVTPEFMSDRDRDYPDLDPTSIRAPR